MKELCVFHDEWIPEPTLSRRNRATLRTELEQILIPRVFLVDDLRKVDVPSPRVGMRVRNVVHSGRVMPPYNCTITIAGWHIFWLSLRSLLLGILRLLLIRLPVL